MIAESLEGSSWSKVDERPGTVGVAIPTVGTWAVPMAPERGGAHQTSHHGFPVIVGSKFV